MTAIALFTRDLRLADNPVLVGAGADVIPLFVESSESAPRSPNQVAYLRESLRELDRSLQNLGSSLVYRRGDFAAEVAKVVEESGAQELHIGRDAPARAQQRVQVLREQLPIPVTEHDSIMVVDPTAIAPASAAHYQRFTPYFKRWRAADRRPLLVAPTMLQPHSVATHPIPEAPTADTSPDRQLGGERAARDLFGAWLANSTEYGETRDQLAKDGTSRVSAALHFGELSALEVVEAGLEYGADEFVRQIAWRDFNHQLLFHRPELEHEGLRASTIQVSTDEDALDTWRRGMTGYPVVDAAMRQLLETGWMHNRARMLTASFLTKHLLQDWRIGADWFLRWLTDADIANNQLGWQWVAGVGVDTNPWRMFNPTLQSRRYDPDGAYIRRWVPELSAPWVDDVHDPSDDVRQRSGYPTRIIEHRDAVAQFKGRPRPDGRADA